MLGAGTASAIMVKLPHGGYANYASVTGGKAPRAARIFDAAFTNLDYSGGPVMPSNTNYTVVWQPSNYGSHTPFQSGYVAGVNRYFADLAAASGQSSNADAVATQFNDVFGNTAAYHASNGGILTDTHPLPANGCPAATGHICLSDAQLQAELDGFLASRGVASGLSHEYFLLTPPDVASCFDAAGSACSANADVSQAFCAYHSQTSASYVYSNIPDLAGVFGCDPFVTSCPNFSCNYNNGPADGVLSAISHEHVESITDPQPNNAWTDWGSNVGGEIGDKCNNDAMNDPNLVPQDNGFGTDTPYNQSINGTHYLLQREWSNQTAQCLDSFTANGTTASASFTTSAGSGNALTFDAGTSRATGGVAEYVWQFNDGPSGSQTSTVETSSPTISHTFPSAGSYYVALTVMAADGTSNGTAQTVSASPPPSNPTAAFTSSPSSPVEGGLVAFDGTGSSDPNHTGSISTYSWNFGDGATATGATPSHAFSRFGSYTVTLTVTDSFGLTNATSAVIAVGDELPTATFAAPSATAGTPVSFSGSGSDADGSIASYSWSYGDGGTGSGPLTSHTYSAPGTYTVTMTITDSDGRAASASHPVTVAPAPVTPGPVPPAPVPPNPVPPGTVPPGSHAAQCVVPNVRHKTLSSAETAIRAAHCAVGTIKRPHSKPKHKLGKHMKWVLLVATETPGAGSVRPPGTAVAVRLAYQAVRT